jgi:hypothetical protein
MLGDAMQNRQSLRLIAVGLWLLVGAAVLLFTAISFPPALAHPEIAGAILAAAGTIFAGIIAWLSVERQLRDADAQRLQDRADIVMSAAADLLVLSKFIGNPGPDYPATLVSVRAKIDLVDRVNINLAALMRAAVDDASRVFHSWDFYRQNRYSAESAATRERRQWQERQGPLSFRLAVLSHAVGRASDAYRNSRLISHEGIVSREFAEKEATDSNVTLAELRYIEPVVEK